MITRYICADMYRQVFLRPWRIAFVRQAPVSQSRGVATIVHKDLYVLNDKMQYDYRRSVARREVLDSLDQSQWSRVLAPHHLKPAEISRAAELI